MRLVASIIIVSIFALGSLLYFMPGSKIDLTANENGVVIKNTKAVLDQNILTGTTSSTATEIAVASTSKVDSVKVLYKDIEPQKPLPNPPQAIKAIYSTSWSAGSKKKVDYFIDLIKSTELNAIVIDIKDFSGHVLYDTQNEDVIRYGAKEVRIPKLNTLIKRFHDEGIYVIARQTVFQDPVLAKARPTLAIQKRVTLAPAVIETNGTSSLVKTATSTTYITWLDNKGLAWIDPGAKEAWDYNIAIAKDAAARGFDEINFDYVRFPSDGAINTMHFSHYDIKNVLKVTQIKNFFEYLRENTPGITISADLFGLVTVNNDDLGIGQNLKSAAPYFDALAPMVYPSHYAKGFIGFENPAAHPSEVVTYSMQQAIKKLIPALTCDDGSDITSTTSTSTNTATSTATSSLVTCASGKVEYTKAKLRPWLQDFNLGANYNAGMVRAQINAVDKIIKATPVYNGWMLWNPSNVYTKGALEL